MTVVASIPDRPEWDDWFMTLCFVIAQRSIDKHTKHGCVVVDNSKSILSVGYNSPPRNCNDFKIPLERPEKYMYMEHAESNAISNAARVGTPLNGSTFYITGPPCHECYRRIINVGASRIVCGPIQSTMVTPEVVQALAKMGQHQKMETMSFENGDAIRNLLHRTEDYLDEKLGEIG